MPKSNNPADYTPRPVIQITRQSHGNAVLTQVRAHGDTSTGFLIDPQVTAHDAIGVPVHALDAAVVRALLDIEAANGRGLHAEALSDYVSKQMSGIPKLFSAAVESVKNARRHLLVREARGLEFGDTVPAALRSDLRAWFIGHDLAERYPIAMKADFPLAVALFEGGSSLCGLSSEIWQQFTQRYAALNHLENSGLAASYEMKSSEEFITAAGVDQGAAFAAAVAAVKALDTERETLNLSEIYLKALARSLALLGNQFNLEWLLAGK